jgi:hypothetical protein
VLTLGLQSFNTVLGLAFGILSLLVARALRNERGLERYAWYVTGVVIVVQYLPKALQDVFGTTAYFAGPETALYTAYLTWAPVANHSRGVLRCTLFLALIAVAVLGRRSVRHQSFFHVVVVVSALLGGVAGYFEGSIMAARHFTHVAASESLGLVLGAAVLMMAMFRPLMDIYLWICLVLVAFRGVVSALFMAALAWADVPGAWTPAPWHLQLVLAMASILIVTAAVVRLRLARQGRAVGDLLPPERPRRPILP